RHDDLPFLAGGPASSRDAFFKISNSQVWRPMICSSSATRAWCSWACSSPANSSGSRYLSADSTDVAEVGACLDPDRFVGLPNVLFWTETPAVGHSQGWAADHS